MALQFPTSSIAGATYQSGSSATYKYNGSYWETVTPSTQVLLTATSASFALTSTSASVALTSVSSSFAVSSSRAVSSSLATTASFVSGGPNGRSSNFISAIVDAGTVVQLDNLKATITTTGNRGLTIGGVSTSFNCNLNGWYGLGSTVAGGSAESQTYTTTFGTSLFGWNFANAGAGGQVNVADITTNRFYRITFIIGLSYNNNNISIERLF
jgi:hypothetical protein